jgi:hypothetical protein
MPLAAIEDVMPFLIPIVLFMIPIVWILTYHQRKMAELMHGSGSNALPNPEINELRREVQELKQVVHQQTIAIDNLKALPSGAMKDRLTEAQ